MKKQKKVKMLMAWVTKEQLDKIEAVKRERGITQSGAVRFLLDNSRSNLGEGVTSETIQQKDEKGVVVNEIMTVSEVAEHLRIAEDTVRTFLRKGELKGKRIGKKWRIPRKNIDDFLDNKPQDDQESEKPQDDQERVGGDVKKQKKAKVVLAWVTKEQLDKIEAVKRGRGVNQSTAVRFLLDNSRLDLGEGVTSETIQQN